MPTVSIIIPCYNEEHTVRELLEKVFDVPFEGWRKEVVIVDDASQDGTRAILRGYEGRATVIYQEKNQGKGSAVKRGLEAAHGQYAIIQDADLEYEPADIPALLAALGAAQVIFGSRTIAP